MKFYRNDNQGVTAIVTEEVYSAILAWRRDATSDVDSKGVDQAHRLCLHLPYPRPVFTFVKSELIAERPWLTGDYRLMDALLRNREVERDPSIYVPFSSGIERPDSLLRTAEMELVTTLSEAIGRSGCIGVSLTRCSSRVRCVASPRRCVAVTALVCETGCLLLSSVRRCASPSIRNGEDKPRCNYSAKSVSMFSVISPSVAPTIVGQFNLKYFYAEASALSQGLLCPLIISSPGRLKSR